MIVLLDREVGPSTLLGGFRVVTSDCLQNICVYVTLSDSTRSHALFEKQPPSIPPSALFLHQLSPQPSSADVALLEKARSSVVADLRHYLEFLMAKEMTHITMLMLEYPKNILCFHGLIAKV